LGYLLEKARTGSYSLCSFEARSIGTQAVRLPRSKGEETKASPAFATLKKFGGALGRIFTRVLVTKNYGGK
jgi:hypothetical protein